MEIEVFFSYADFNEVYGEVLTLSEDTHVEQLAFVVVIYKWRWNGAIDAPYLPFPGVELAQEVKIHDKRDAFIFERI